MLTSSLIIAGGKYPNLEAASNLIQSASQKITDAQKANEYDLGGHAVKAKNHLAQADKEIKLAIEAASK